MGFVLLLRALILAELVLRVGVRARVGRRARGLLRLLGVRWRLLVCLVLRCCCKRRVRACAA